MKEEEVLEGIIYPPTSRFYTPKTMFQFSVLLLFAMEFSVLLCLFIYHCTRRIRDITKEVAAAVVREAVAENLAEGYRDMDARELERLTEVVNHLPNPGFIIMGFFSLLNYPLQFVLQEETIEYVKNNMWNPVYPTVVYKKD
jgi:malate dehydrogenase (decarboxylating)